MKLLSYILSPIFAVSFFLILIVFHPLQWLSYNIFGYSTFQKVVDVMNFCLVKNLLLLGIRVKVHQTYDLPKGESLIFVSNHQSLFDISPISWHFRKYSPKFVSKKELGQGIPSVSYNLRKGGAVLIDRKNGKQAIIEMAKFAKRLNAKKWSGVIFPEGTRSKTGQPKSFAESGLKVLTKYNPEGYIVPLTINNSWKVFKYGTFPFGIGSPIIITTHAPIAIKSLPFKELMEETEQQIIKDII
ncbi:MAG: lysophospholipid acyltransferase family protein [Flavobacteriaceae bacterium]